MPRIKSKPRKLGKTTRPVRTVVGRRVGYMGRYKKRTWHKGEKNYASVKETYQYFITAGVMNYFVDALANLNYDRAIAVAQAYQQYRIKYFKLTIKPNNDTYPSAGGAVVPNAYFMVDYSRAIPLGANFNTLLDLGAKPVRIDDKIVSRSFRPCVLTADKDGAGTTSASQIRRTPWLSTNANAGNPTGAWLPDETVHQGMVYAIEKVNPGDVQQYSVNVECMFEFRRPNWKTPSSESAEAIPYAVHQINKGTPLPAPA